jgi:hypothetical protein
MTVTLAPLAKQQFNQNGVPLAGGKLFTYNAGTTTKALTYTDSTGDTPNTNPIILDSNGQCGVWLLPTNAYKFVLSPSTDTDPPTNPFWTVDNVTTGQGAAVGNMTDEKGSGGTPGFVANVDFTPGTTTQLTLSQNYGSSDNLWVTFDTDDQGADQFSLGGTNNTTLTFTSPIPSGINKVYVKGGTALTIGTPGNGTVFDAQVATGAAIQSSKLSFLSTLAGAVAYSVQAKLSQIVSVKDFGATGNGTTDDTAAVQAAVNAVGIAGGTVYFPAGNYLLSAITVSQNGVYLKGSGRLGTTITPSSQTDNVFSFSGTECQGISDMYILYTTAPTTGIAIYVNNVQDFTCQNIKIYGAFTGIYVLNGAIQYYQNIDIQACIGSTGIGIVVNGGNDQYFSKVWIGNDIPAAQPFACMQVLKNLGLFLSQCDMTGSEFGLLIAPANSGDEVAFVFVDSCGFDTCSAHGIYIIPGNQGASVYSCHFVNCWSSSCTGHGVFLSGIGAVNGIRFVGHRSYNNGQLGYYCQPSSNGQVYNITFDTCVASGNSNSSHGTYPGFSFYGGMLNFSMMNCRSGPADGFPNTQSLGALINAGACNFYSIIGNDLSGNMTGGLQDFGTGTSKNVSKNLGYNPLAGSAITVGASPFTYTNNTGDTVVVGIGGGTVSSIELNGFTVGVATNTNVSVPQGAALQVTYSSAPSMAAYGT